MTKHRALLVSPAIYRRGSLSQKFIIFGASHQAAEMLKQYAQYRFQMNDWLTWHWIAGILAASATSDDRTFCVNGLPGLAIRYV